MLMIHELLTDERESVNNDADLQAFASAAFGYHHLPDDEDLPWCIELAAQPVGAPMGLPLYLAKAVTDLRPRSVEGE